MTQLDFDVIINYMKFDKDFFRGLVIIILLCLFFLPIVPIGPPYYTWEKIKASKKNSENEELDGYISDMVAHRQIRIAIPNLIRYDKNEPIYPKNIIIKSFSVTQNKNIIADIYSISRINFRTYYLIGPGYHRPRDLDKTEMRLFYRHGSVDLTRIIDDIVTNEQYIRKDDYDAGYLDLIIDDLPIPFNNRGKITALVTFEYNDQLGESFERESKVRFGRKFHSNGVPVWLFILMWMAFKP